MTIKQTYEKEYLEFITKLIEGRFCHKCKSFSDSNCNLCRKCGAEL